MTALAPVSPPGLLAALRSGFRVSLRTILLILAINTGYAVMQSVEDPRPFWHPLLSAQCFGLAIAYAVNVASPWERTRPVWRLIAAVAAGTVIGYALIVLFKGYALSLDGYTLTAMVSDSRKFQWSLLAGFGNGMLVSLFFLLKFRDVRTAEALHRAEAERHLLSKQAVESELKLMQAQVEPHFLFNTLASVQFLTETDPPQASRMLGHLLAYLRAALPQLRRASTTLGQELDLAEAYLNILRMRMGPRLDFAMDVPDALRGHPFPPVLLISVVENAVTHGLEPQADGGRVTIAARRNGDRLAVTVTDTGSGLSGKSQPGQGVGLSNLRDRLAALFGDRARFALEEYVPRGVCATIEIPFENATHGAAIADATA